MLTQIAVRAKGRMHRETSCQTAENGIMSIFLPSVTCQSLLALQRLCSALPEGCHSCQLAPPAPEQSEEWPQQASRRPGEDDKKVYLTAPVQTLSDQSYCCWDDLITSRLSLWSSCRTEIMLEEDGANNLLAATD